MPADISFEQYRDRWLDDVQAGQPSTVELGHRFARKLLTQWLDVDDASDDLVYCDGAGDGGIDIAYLYRGDADDADTGAAQGHTWYLLQSKYGSAFRGEGTLIDEGRKVIDTLDGTRQNLSSLATGLRERLANFRDQASERDRIVLVFGTEYPLSESQRRALTDVRTLGQSRLGSVFDVESVSIDTIYRRLQDEATGSGVTRPRVSIKATVATSADDLLVGVVALTDLYAFLRAYRMATDDLDRLYEKNVRRFLGTRGKVNKAMERTLRETPEHFGLYNNGITIVVADFARGDDGCVTLVDPYVVNGCQTTRTIWEVCDRRLNAGGTGQSAELVAWQERAQQGMVVTKIVKVGLQGATLLQDITRYTNSQNAVREKDFLALASDFSTWARQMADQHGIFLEVQRGGWESQRAYQQQHPSGRQFGEMANAFDLLKVYGAGWLREAGTAFGKNAAFLPGGAIYRRIMQEDGETRFGVDDLYAAYQLKLAADGYGFGRGAERSSRRQTRFLFYMVAIELLTYVLQRRDSATATPTDRSRDVTPADLTQAIIRIAAGTPEVRDALFDTAVNLIDEYLTAGTEDCVQAEPAYRNTFNGDLNGFLKWEQLGKNDQVTPRFRALLAVTQRTMGRRAGSVSSPLELINSALL